MTDRSADAGDLRDLAMKNAKATAVPLRVPPLPGGDRILSPVELTELFLQVFEEEARPAARVYLMEVFTKKFPKIQQDSEPRRMLEVIYEGMVRELMDYPPEGKLQWAHWEASEVRIAELHEVAMSLALARYVREHPRAKTHPAALFSLEGFHIERWDSLSIPEIAAEATRRREELDRLDQRARSIDVHAWGSLEDDQWEVEMTLDSARTGDYSDAMGSLYSFLHDIGARVNLHETH